MNTNDNDLDKNTRKWMNESGLERPHPDFTHRVMEQVEARKKRSSLRSNGNIWNILLAVLLPLAYFGYSYNTGGGVAGGFSLQTELQPYIRVFQLIVEKLAIDMSAPLVPLGIAAIVALLAFDRLILRSLSYNR